MILCDLDAVVCSGVDNDGHAVDADELGREHAAARDGVRVAAMVVSIIIRQLVRKYNIPRHTAEDSDRGTASADGDVQGRDIDAEQGKDDALSDRVDRVRVLDVLAALSPARRRATSRAGGDGGGHSGEGEEGGEELHV
jgi:hypothetical protein